MGEAATKRKRRRTGGSDVELGLTAETNLQGEGAGSLCSSSTRRRRGRGGAAALLSGSSEDEREDGFAAATEAAVDVWGGDEAQDDSDEVSSELEDDDDEDEGVGKSRSSKAARQRKRGRGHSTVTDRDAAHMQQPIDALNVSFARVVNLLLQQQTFKVGLLL